MPFRHTLLRLPLTTLSISPTAHSSLRNVNFQHLHSLHTLPQTSLTHHTNRPLISTLSHLFNRSTSTLPHCQPPAHRTTNLIFSNQIRSISNLHFPLQQLVSSLTHALTHHSNKITNFSLILRRRSLAPAQVTINLIRPRHSTTHLLSLTFAHVRHITLPTPIIKLEVRTSTLPPFTPTRHSLFRHTHRNKLS